MATWSNTSRNSASFSNTSRNSATFSNTSRSLRTYGELTNDEIGTLSNESIINGKAVGDYTNDDTVGPIWSPLTRN